MKFLTDLNPQWIVALRNNSGEGIEFDCPECGWCHRIVVYFANPMDRLPPAPRVKHWTRIGDDFESITVEPAIQHSCFHGWITLGVVTSVKESVASARNAQGQRVALSPRQILQAMVRGDLKR